MHLGEIVCFFEKMNEGEITYFFGQKSRKFSIDKPNWQSDLPVTLWMKGDQAKISVTDATGVTIEQKGIKGVFVNGVRFAAKEGTVDLYLKEGVHKLSLIKNNGK